MMKQWTLLALSAALLLVGAGCNNDQACAIDDDCFRGEFCIDGSCGTDPGGADAGPTTDGGSSNNDDGDPSDVGRSDDDASTSNNETNNDPADAGDDNMTDMGGGDDSGGGEDSGGGGENCVADPFDASCRADDNDSFREYIFFPEGAPGCDNNDDFVPQSGGVANAQLCALEDQDLYDLNLVPCDDLSFVVELTVTPVDDQCTHAHYDFNVNVQGNDCDDPGETIRCEDLPGGVKRVSAIVQPSNSLASARIDVTKGDFDNAHFDYDLDIVVRQ